MTRSKMKNGLLALVAVLAMGACDSLLTVQDPQRYTADDLNTALPAVANGVEGAVHTVMDNFVVYQALLADEYQHTGTWGNYDEVDHGRFQYGTSPMDGTHSAWLRAQWFATDAERRFRENLGEAEAASSTLTAQVRLGGAFADLYMGMSFCESVGEASGPAITDMQALQQAVQKFTDAMQTAQAAGRSDYATAAQAGRAQARLLLGDLQAAAADAAAIPDDFSYEAVFNQTVNNWVVLVTTKTFNEAAGLLHKWWDQIDKNEAPGYMRDPWTNEYDMRIPVFFDGEVATDNETPHYSQWKYNGLTDNIPMVHSDLMRLIQAEALVNSGDYAGATAILNQLRDAVGLAPFDTPADQSMMMEYLLSERFAELFMEGQRAIDFHRFGLTRQMFDALDDPEREGAGRPTKFTMTDAEPLYNPNIENDLTKRCAPKA